MSHTELHRQLGVSPLSKSTCIELGLLEKGWPQTRVATAAALSVEQPHSQEPAAPPVHAGRDLAAVKEAIVAEFRQSFKTRLSAPWQDHQCTSTCAALPCTASNTGLAQCHFSGETQWRHSFRLWGRKASLKKSQWVSHSHGAIPWWWSPRSRQQSLGSPST